MAADGSFAIYGGRASTVNLRRWKGWPTYRYRTNLWRIDLNNAERAAEQLTFGDRGDSRRRSARTAHTAFVRVDTAGGAAARSASQVWLLPLRVRVRRRRSRNSRIARAAPVWRPDGKGAAGYVSNPISSSRASRASTWKARRATGSIRSARTPGSKVEIEARRTGIVKRCGTGWRAMPRRTIRRSSTASTSWEQDVHEMEIAGYARRSGARIRRPVTRDFYNHLRRLPPMGGALSPARPRWPIIGPGAPLRGVEHGEQTARTRR